MLSVKQSSSTSKGVPCSVLACVRRGFVRCVCSFSAQTLTNIHALSHIYLHKQKNNNNSNTTIVTGKEGKRKKGK
jgi:hypothetical protein